MRRRTRKQMIRKNMDGRTWHIFRFSLLPLGTISILTLPNAEISRPSSWQKRDLRVLFSRYSIVKVSLPTSSRKALETHRLASFIPAFSLSLIVNSILLYAFVSSLYIIVKIASPVSPLYPWTQTHKLTSFIPAFSLFLVINRRLLYVFVSSLYITVNVASSEPSLKPGKQTHKLASFILSLSPCLANVGPWAGNVLSAAFENAVICALLVSPRLHINETQGITVLLLFFWLRVCVSSCPPLPLFARPCSYCCLDP